jgi:DNA-binding CsgD family transcriptional regulator
LPTGFNDPFRQGMNGFRWELPTAPRGTVSETRGDGRPCCSRSHVRNNHTFSIAKSRVTARSERHNGCPLTARELEILRLMAHEGLMREGVAHRLGLKASTVRTHTSKAYRKLGVNTAAQAIVVCFNAGWLDPSATEIDDPLRFEDRNVTSAQRLYLAAFDQHLAARDDVDELSRVKTLTDASLGGLLQTSGRSETSRDWLDRLVDRLAAAPEALRRRSGSARRRSGGRRPMASRRTSIPSPR